MNILLISVIACQKIVEKKEPLKKIMFSFDVQYNFSNAQKNRIQKLIKGVLKNFIALKYEVLSNFENVKPREKKLYLLICTLFSVRYQQKEVSLDSLKEEFAEIVEEWKTNIDVDKTFAALVDLGNSSFVIPEQEKENPIKYNSLVFSTPEWVIRLWLKQFGLDTTMKLLIANQKPGNFYVKRNELKVTAKNFEQNKLFKPIKNFENAYAFVKKSGFSETEEAQLGNCFKEDLSYQEILNNIPITAGCQALFLNGERDELALDLAVRLKEANGDLTLNIEDEIKFRKSKYKFEKIGITNESTYLSNIDLLRTYIEYNSFDLVIVMPRSSRFGLIKKKAEILANTGKQDYKKLKYYQVSCLEDASRYIHKDGVFAYVVETINKSESEAIVDMFLEKHQEFELVTARQIMPFENNNNGVYYAVLRGNYERQE